MLGWVKVRVQRRWPTWVCEGYYRVTECLVQERCGAGQTCCSSTLVSQVAKLHTAETACLLSQGCQQMHCWVTAMPSLPAHIMHTVSLHTSARLQIVSLVTDFHVSLLHLAAVLQKSDAPELSEEKRRKQEKPLDFLVQQAAVDPSTKWRRVYQLGRYDTCGLLLMCLYHPTHSGRANMDSSA